MGNSQKAAEKSPPPFFVAELGILAAMRYPPSIIILHWLLAALIFITFGLATLALVPAANTPAKLIPLWAHMALGLAIFLLTAARLLIRARSAKKQRPARKLTTRRAKPLLAQIAGPVQILLYAVSLLMSLTGMGLAWQAGYAANLKTMPANFYAFSLRAVHGTLSTLLVILVVLHLLTWVYYQFLRGENALAWIWFRPKKNE